MLYISKDFATDANPVQWSCGDPLPPIMMKEAELMFQVDGDELQLILMAMTDYKK